MFTFPSAPTRRPFAPAVRPRAALGVLATCAALTAPASVRASGLLIADGGFGGRLEIEEHDVRVTINNGVAVTEVTQVFRNLENREVEALYSFPVPRGASVSAFSLWIDGRELVGEVVEKERAREIYETSRARGVDPGLLEQIDYRTFEMRVFPIRPRATQRVAITYYQEVDHDHDEITWVYPLATNTRQFAASRTTGTFSLTADIASAVPITRATSPSHADDVSLVMDDPTWVRAGLEILEGDLERDVVLRFAVERPVTGLDLIASRASGEDGYFCLLFTAGEDLGKVDVGMDWVFILDVSGSMAQGDKLSVSRRSLGAFISSLGSHDRFELVTFNAALESLFAGLESVSDGTRTRALSFLASREGKGGTDLAPAIDAAFRYGDADRQLNVVLLSDGLTQPDARSIIVDRVRGRRKNSRFFSIGVGSDVHRPLLEQLASEAGGFAAFVSASDDFESQARAFRRKLSRPAITDVSLRFSDIDVWDLEPQRLPDLYHGAPIRVYGRYRTRPGAQPSLTVGGRILGRDTSRTVDFGAPEVDDSNPEIERMWAAKRIDRLLKDADATGGRAPVVAEVVALGEAYSIVTEHTSFIVLEDDEEYRRWKIERRNLVRNARDRQSRELLVQRRDAVRSRARNELGPGAVEKSVEVADASAVAPRTIASRGASSQAASRSRTAPERRDPGRETETPERRRRSTRIDLGRRGGSGPVGPLFVAIAALAARRRRSR